MTTGVLIEVWIELEYRERFLHATRLYALHTRNEASKPKIEVLELDDGHSFLIRESYPNEAAVGFHSRTEHARGWLELMSTLVDGPIAARRFSALVSESPPLPRAPKPPALEAATTLPSTRREAIGWGKASSATARDALPSSQLQLPRLQAMVERVEVASAHDGFLRGAPDLCLLSACYRVVGVEIELLGRAIYRFELAEPTPCEVLRRDRVLDLPVLVEHFPLRIYVVVVAFEENGGSDVRSTYQDLSEPSSLLLWSLRQDEPNPIGLGQHAAQLRVNQSEPVQTLRVNEAQGKPVQDDSWVGAATGLVEFSGQGEERLLRCHTRSRDGRNDWLWDLGFRFA
jgi:quinol monooxygenase YgiN